VNTRAREVVETDFGLGKLFCEEEFIGEVEYRYQIAQETTSKQTQSGIKNVPGLQNLHGSFATKSTIDLLGKEMRLITSKGKELQITIMAGDPVVKVYIFIFGQSGQN
jgi:hypothetical protein